MDQVIARALSDPAFVPTFISLISLLVGVIAGVCMLYTAHRYGAAIHTLLDPPDGEGPGKHGRPLHVDLHIMKCLGLFGLLWLAANCGFYLTLGKCFTKGENGRRKTIKLDLQRVPKSWKYAIMIPTSIYLISGITFLVSGLITMKMQVP